MSSTHTLSVSLSLFHTDHANNTLARMFPRYSGVIDRMVAGNFECPGIYIRRSALYMASKQFVAARVDALR